MAKHEHYFMVNGDKRLHLHSDDGTAYEVAVSNAGSLTVTNSQTGEVSGGGGGSVAVDPTLSVSGMAADAKATGDKFTALSEDIDELKNGGVVGTVTKDDVDFIAKRGASNIYNPVTMATSSAWFYWADNSQTGAGSAVSMSQGDGLVDYMALEIPIDLAGDITIQMPGDGKIYSYFFVDADNLATTVYATGVNATLKNGYTVTAPDGAAKLLISLSGYGWAFDNKTNIMVNYGSEALAWEPYKERYVLVGVAVEDDRINAAESIVGGVPNTVKLMLPEKYALVVGDTFELFYKGIINAVNPDLFDVRVTCIKGNAYTKRYIWTPTADDIGNHDLTVELFGINHNLIAKKTIQLVVKAKATSPVTPINVLCIGDSLTTNGVWPAEVYRRLTATDGTPVGNGLSNINFIGTRKAAAGKVGYEGYGGWKFESYTTEQVSTNRKVITCVHDKVEAVDQHSIYKDETGIEWKIETVYDGSILIIALTGEGFNFPEAGTLTWVSGGVNHADIVYTASENAPGNPFWNANTNSVDIANYVSKLGASGIDYIYVMLGWNDAAKTESEYKNQVQTFIHQFVSYNPNVKIIAMGLQIPARDGLGANYGAYGVYADYHALMQHVFRLDKWYTDLASVNPDHLTTINIAGQFDTEHNMPESTRTVNVRNPKPETYQANGVHPETPGYMQIADAVYRDLTHKLQS